MNFIKLAFILGILFCITSCKDEDPPGYGGVDFLDNNELVESLSLDDAKSILSEQSSTLGNACKHSVKCYSIDFKTKFQGSNITSSGIVATPNSGFDADHKYPIIIFNHQHITKDTNAPSILGYSQNEVVQFATALASAGYIVAIPDYIGYGTTDNIAKAYLYQDAYTDLVCDFMDASYEFILSEKVAWPNGKALITGYDEGAYATTAALKHYHSRSDNKVKLTAAAVCDGVYDAVSLLEYIKEQRNTGNNRFTASSMIVKLIESSMEYAENTNTYSDYFTDQYSVQIDNFIGGDNTKDEVNTAFSPVIQLVYNANFIQNFNSDELYSNFYNYIVSNVMQGWSNTVPLTLYDSQQDNIKLNSTHATSMQELIENEGGEAITEIIHDGNEYNGPYKFFEKLVSSL